MTKPTKEGEALTVYIKQFPKQPWNRFTGYARILDLMIQETLLQAITAKLYSHLLPENLRHTVDGVADPRVVTDAGQWKKTVQLIGC